MSKSSVKFPSRQGAPPLGEVDPKPGAGDDHDPGIVESAAEGIAVLDAQGVLQLANWRLYELLGRQSGELMGRRVADWFGGAARDVLETHLAATRRGETAIFRIDVSKPDGSPLRLQLTFKPLLEREGTCEGLIGFFTAVLPRGIGEDFFPEVLQQDFLLADPQEVIFWEADPDTLLFSQIGSSAEDLLGYPRQCWLNELGFLARVLHPEDRNLVMDHFLKAARECTFHTFECRMLAADNRVVWLRHMAWVGTEKDRPPRFRGIWLDITERRLAEEKARTFARQNQLLLACSGEAICGIDCQGTIIFINPAGAALLGYKPQDLVGRNIHESIHYQHPDGTPYPPTECPILSVLRGQNRVEKVDTFFRADGTPLPVEVVAQTFGEEGSRLGAVVTFRDISDRLRAERERQSKLELLRASAEIFSCLLGESDPARAGHQVVNILGQSAGVDRCYWWEQHEDEGGRSIVSCRAEWCRENVPSYSIDPLFCFFRADALARLIPRLESGEILTVTWSELSPTERDFFATYGAKSFALMPFLTAGRVLGFLGFDSTDPDHRWSEEEANFLRLGTRALVLALERYHRTRQWDELAALVEQLSDSLAIVDLQGSVVYSNPALHRLLGASPLHLSQICHLLARKGGEPLSPNTLLDAVGGGTAWHETLVLQSAAGPKEVETTFSPLYDRSGRVYRACLALVDITPRLELERKFQQAQKMEALGQLAASIAHDFNNLLLVMIASTERAQQHWDAGKPVHEELDTIRTSLARAAELCRRLLAFSRPQLLDRKPVNVTTLLGSMMPLLRRILPETIALGFHPESPELWVLADASQLEHAVMNLVVNARDAMPHGGLLTVTTDRCYLGEEYRVAHPWVLPGSYCCFAVADTGMGMDEATRSRLFEPFFSTKEAGHGTGLGLSTVYGIVKQHGGFIDVMSRPGEGSTFIVYLPATQGPSQMVVQQPRSAVSPFKRGGGEHILLVEDYDQVRSLVARILADEGYRVSQARDGAEALQFIQKRDGDVALVITDLVMPQMGGFKLYQHVHSQYPTIAFLFSSGYADSAPEETPTGPLVDFITKPYSTENLLRKVRELLSQVKERQGPPRKNGETL